MNSEPANKANAVMLSLVLFSVLVMVVPGPRVDAQELEELNEPTPHGSENAIGAAAKLARSTWKGFREEQGTSWKVQWNKKTNLVRTIYGGKTASFGEDAEEAATRFLENYAPMILLTHAGDSEDLRDFHIFRKQETLGGTKITFQQTLHGLSVADGMIDIHIDSEGRVTHVASSLPSIVEINPIPGLTMREAVDFLRQTLETTNVLSILVPPELVIWSNDDAFLAYKIRCSIDEKWNIWEYYLDASTGEILESRKFFLEEEVRKRVDSITPSTTKEDGSI